VSLRLRLLAAFGYVVLLVLVALLVPLVLSVSDRVDTEVKAHAAGQAHLIAASASGQLDDPRALGRLVERAAGDLGGRVIVVGARGRLLADTAGTGLRATSYADRPEIRAALDGRTAQGTRRSETLDEDLLYTAVPVVSEGRRVGAARITQSVEAIDDRIRRDVLALVAIGGVALLMGLVLAWLLAGSLSGPLRALARTARRVERGELDARADPAGSSEQQEVAVAFNDMTARLAEVLAAQRDFVANASHQLRTPLTGLRLRLEAASLKASDPELERDLAAAERETERLAKLLTALLTLARAGERAGTPRPVDLAEAAARACERWSSQAERGGQRLVLAGEQPAVALASPDDVAIVLDNLIENALIYSPPGTTVTLDWRAAGGSAVLAVLDEGPGLQPGEESQVFERFARGSSSRGGAPGTGLGLAIVATLARRWGGDARLTNRDAGGARADVRFPAAAVADDEQPTAVAVGGASDEP
jgi:signal transduction histidine kinase